MLVPAWVVRVHVPVGVSRRRPLAHVEAVKDAIRAARAGVLGEYTDVMHVTLEREVFRPTGGEPAAWVSALVSTYLPGASLAEVGALAERIADAHPWEHPVIECAGPEGTFLWSPR